MITIELKNSVHNTTARVRVNPTGETEINHGPAYNLRKKLCPDKECTCGKNELGAVGLDNPHVVKRGGSCYIIMDPISTKIPTESKTSEGIVSQNDSDMIHYAELESIIMIGGARITGEMLTDEETSKLFKIIRGIRDEQRYGVKLPD